MRGKTLYANATPDHLLATLLAIASVACHAQEALKIVVNRQAQSISAADLKALPDHTVTIHNPHSNADETCSGVPVIELLAKQGVPHGHDLHGKALAQYIVATGSDGYKAVIALAEADPEFHPGEVLVADAMDSKPLDAKTGPFRLVVTEDKRRRAPSTAVCPSR